MMIVVDDDRFFRCRTVKSGNELRRRAPTPLYGLFVEECEDDCEEADYTIAVRLLNYRHLMRITVSICVDRCG